MRAFTARYVLRSGARGTLTLIATIRYVRRALRRAWLVYEISETEAYLRACARDGLIDSLHLREWRGRVCTMRCELASLNAGRTWGS